MALEGKDFDDKAIMAATRQEAGTNGSFRLKITLPISNREVTSEWIPEDKRRQALFAWVDTIRGQVQADVEEYEAKRKAHILAERAKQAAMPAAIVGAGGDTMTSSTSLTPTSSPSTGTATAGVAVQTAPSSASSIVNPDDYIGQQLKLAMIREVEASDALARATQEHADAAKNLSKWRALQDALAAPLGAIAGKAG